MALNEFGEKPEITVVFFAYEEREEVHRITGEKRILYTPSIELHLGDDVIRFSTDDIGADDAPSIEKLIESIEHVFVRLFSSGNKKRINIDELAEYKKTGKAPSIKDESVPVSEALPLPPNNKETLH